MKKLKIILMGAGVRGIGYTDIMKKMGDKYEVVGVAEPHASRRNYIRDTHAVPEDRCFDDWRPLLDLGKIADAAVIATMDQDHYEPALKAMELGYDLLLEKPISNDARECSVIADAAEKYGLKVVICTVLRYTPLFMTLKKMILDGKIGRVMAINHEECVGNLHQAHSFVRGNWGNEERSSCMLLQKSCHDLDLLQWLADGQIEKIQSFGLLSHFKGENAPDGAPDYCIDGCPHGETCYYNAVKRYYDWKENYSDRKIITHKVDPTDDDVEKALRTTQYGKCVYKCDNDVVDHQTVNMLFDNGATVTFTMCAFNEGGRYIHIMGTKGELRAALDGETNINYYSFATRKTEVIEIGGKDGIEFGHGGGDGGIVEAFYDYITGDYKGFSIPSIRQAADNHLAVFAAEKSRTENTVVDFDEYKRFLSGDK